MDNDTNRIFEIDSSSDSPKISDSDVTPEARRAPANSPAFSVDGTKPLARVLDRVVVHASPETDSKVTSYLEAEDVVELHKLWKKSGGWIETRMPGGSMGYIHSETRVSFLERVKLKEKKVEIFNKPSSDGMPVHKLTKGIMFWKFIDVKTTDPSWVAVRLDSGQQGYIPSSSKVKSLPQITYPAVETAGHDVMVGAIWCIAGIAITAGTYAAVEDTGGTYLIAWGPVVFGGFQFLRGLFRAAVAERATIYDDNTVANNVVTSGGMKADAGEVVTSGGMTADTGDLVTSGGMMDFRDCHHCGVKGMLPMPGNKCPNCKKSLD